MSLLIREDITLYQEQDAGGERTKRRGTAKREKKRD